MAIFPEASTGTAASSPSTPVVYLIQFNEQLGHKHKRIQAGNYAFATESSQASPEMPALAKNN